MTDSAKAPSKGAAIDVFTVAANPPTLDQISVFFQDLGPHKGRVIVECYGEAWAAWWGAMPEETVREFVQKADADYVANKLWPQSVTRTKKREAYLLRIVTAVKEALKFEAERLLTELEGKP